MKGFIRLAGIVTSLLLAMPLAGVATAADAVVPPLAPAIERPVPGLQRGQLHVSLRRPSDHPVPAERGCGPLRLGAVNATVNVYDVDDDLQMGIPVADCDVVRENFAAFPGVGGYPGDGGTTGARRARRLPPELPGRLLVPAQHPGQR